MERLNDAIQVDPGQGSLYSNLGVLQLARGDRQMAEASFKKAVNAAPKKVGTQSPSRISIERRVAQPKPKWS